VNDGDYGSHDVQYGVEMDVPPSFESPSEFITELHVNLANQLYDALVEQNILSSGD
jgi:hypothetical protein